MVKSLWEIFDEKKNEKNTPHTQKREKIILTSITDSFIHSTKQCSAAGIDFTSTEYQAGLTHLSTEARKHESSALP